jgi:hypothetical protein
MQLTHKRGERGVKTSAEHFHSFARLAKALLLDFASFRKPQGASAM